MGLIGPLSLFHQSFGLLKFGACLRSVVKTQRQATALQRRFDLVDEHAAASGNLLDFGEIATGFFQILFCFQFCTLSFEF